MVSTAVGAVTSAVNEGRIEALNNSKDWQNLKVQELDDIWKQKLNEKYQPELDALKAEYDAALAEYESTKGTLQRAGSGIVQLWQTQLIRSTEPNLIVLTKDGGPTKHYECYVGQQVS